MAVKSLLLLGIVLASLLFVTQDVAAATDQFTDKANESDGKKAKPTSGDGTNEEKMGHRHRYYGGGGYGGGYGGGGYGGGYGVGYTPGQGWYGGGYGHYPGHGGGYGGVYGHYPGHGGGYGGGYGGYGGGWR